MHQNNVKSAYIHIPFCKSKCKYCSFISGDNFDKKTGYLYSLLKEIDYYYNKNPLETLYIGGGTPSTFSAVELGKIINKFSFTETAEITIEVNPNDVNYDYMISLKDLGINRISIGAQSFDDNILKLIGRRHNSQEIFNAVDAAQKAGFDNISLDLIYGLPEQTTEGFKKDLETVIKTCVQHLSLYGLKIDEGCYFYNHYPQNLPDDDTQADMYLMAGEITSRAGFEHYEISNYSKKGFNSRHNTNYWECGEYYGFGLSAHGYIDNLRYSNTTKLDEYLSNPLSHNYGKFLTKKEQIEESIFLGLRLSKGIDVQKINEKFSINFDKNYGKILAKFLDSGHLEKTKNGYRLSDKKECNGFLISNLILSEFID